MLIYCTLCVSTPALINDCCFFRAQVTEYIEFMAHANSTIKADMTIFGSLLLLSGAMRKHAELCLQSVNLLTYLLWIRNQRINCKKIKQFTLFFSYTKSYLVSFPLYI